MYAVIETGGKQYKVLKNKVYFVERMSSALSGTFVHTFDRVLMVGIDGNVRVGSPFVEGAKVVAECTPCKGEKVVIFKKKRRHNYRRKMGHRQSLLRIKITDIAA